MIIVFKVLTESLSIPYLQSLAGFFVWSYLECAIMEAWLFFDGLSYFPFQKCKETRENTITQPQSHPIPELYILNGMGLRLANGISPCFFAFLRGGV